MKEWMRIGLYFISAFLYLALLVIWVASPTTYGFNIAITVFSFSVTGIVIYLDKERWSVLYRSKWFKKFSSVVISAVLLFFIISMLNFWGYRFPSQFDFSHYELNSLTKESYEILARLESKLDFKIFSRNREKNPIVTLLDLYRYHKNDISIETIDIDLRPDLVEKHQITKPDSILINYENRTTIVETADELSITNGILKVLRKDPVNIGYVINHQELSLHSQTNDGLSFLKSLFENFNFKTTEVDLTKIALSKLLSFDALMIWGPKSGFLKFEIDLIDQFLEKKGKLIVSIDPNLNNDPISDLRKLLFKHGIEIRNSIVVDRLNHVNGSDGSVPFVKTFNQEHQISSNFLQAVFFPLTSGIESSGIGKFHSIAQTNIYPASWADFNPKDLVINGKLEFNQGVDQKGPITLMGAWEDDDNQKLKTRVIAFGNSTFVTNAYQKFVGNFKLLMNGISWAIYQDHLISFDLGIGKPEPVLIKPIQIGIIFYFSVLFVPLFCIGVAITIFIRRSKL